MDQVTSVLLVALLVLSCPCAVLSASLSSELYTRSADAGDMDDNTADEERIPAPFGPYPLLKGVSQRGIARFALPCATRQLIPPPLAAF